ETLFPKHDRCSGDDLGLITLNVHLDQHGIMFGYNLIESSNGHFSGQRVTVISDPISGIQPDCEVNLPWYRSQGGLDDLHATAEVVCFDVPPQRLSRAGIGFYSD